MRSYNSTILFQDVLTFNCCKTAKVQDSFEFFIVLGIHNFVNSWCGCGKTAWCDARIDISKWIFIAIDVHSKLLPESFSMAGYWKFHLKIQKCCFEKYCKSISFASFLFNKLTFCFVSLASHQPIWLWRSLNGEDFYTYLFFNKPNKLLVGPTQHHFFSQFWAVEKKIQIWKWSISLALIGSDWLFG